MAVRTVSDSKTLTLTLTKVRSVPDIDNGKAGEGREGGGLLARSSDKTKTGNHQPSRLDTYMLGRGVGEGGGYKTEDIY